MRKNSDLQDQVQLAEDGAKDGEATQEGSWDQRVAAHADVEGACVVSK